MSKKSSSPKVLDQEAVKFCFRNGYKIYPIHKDYNMYVMVEYGNKRKAFHVPYTPKTIHDGVIDMYHLIYDKQKDK